MFLELSIITAFLSGLLMFLSPCIFPLLPVYFAILEKDNKKVRNTVLFLLGLSTAFVTLAFSFGIIGSYIYTPTTRRIFAVIVIIMGLQQLGIFNFNFLNKTKRLNIKPSKNSGIQSFLMGFSFSIGWSPCIGPILGSIILYSIDNILLGSIFLAIFILGFILPFVIFTIFYEKLSRKINFIKSNLENLKKLSGIIIIIMGILLFFKQF